jgi:hypothetical protein
MGMMPFQEGIKLLDKVHKKGNLEWRTLFQNATLAHYARNSVL